MNSPFWSLVMRYFLEFFSMVPCAVLCFLPVQDRLRIKPLNIFLTGIPLSILWAFAGGLVCADFGIPRDFWVLPSFILFAVFFHRVCDLALWKPFSILTAVCAVFSCITNLTLVADALIDRTNTSGLFTLPGAGIHLLLSVLIWPSYGIRQPMPRNGWWTISKWRRPGIYSGYSRRHSFC